jgi:hypothetical protein
MIMTANEFDAVSVRISEPNKAALIITDYGARHTFPYTFYCKSNGIISMFDMSSNKMFVVREINSYMSPGSKPRVVAYRCVIMRFWVENDLPVPSVRWFDNQNEYHSMIADEFREKLAAYTLDNIINS